MLKSGLEEDVTHLDGSILPRKTCHADNLSRFATEVYCVPTCYPKRKVTNVLEWMKIICQWSPLMGPSLSTQYFQGINWLLNSPFIDPLTTPAGSLHE